MTASATVKGKAVTILTNAQGKTLYYDTQDTPTTASCNGGCAQSWPPLLFSGSGTPASSTPLPGKLSVVTTANGTQVAYQGHLLYAFASDSASGQVNGEGIGGIWFAATTDLASAGGSAGPSPTPTRSGY
jgi:predicted lipoprotein with Yx(FWY)xxD motif